MPVIGLAAHARVQTEALRVGARRITRSAITRVRFAAPAHEREHFAPRPRPGRDTITRRGGLQRRHHVGRVHVAGARKISDAVFFDQMPQAREQPQDAVHDFVEQCLQLCLNGRRGFVKHRRAVFRDALVNPVKNQRVQMRIEIRRTAKALDQGDGAAGGFISLDG